MQHLQEIQNRAGALESPLASKWMRERRAFAFDPKLHSAWPEIDRSWLRSFQANGLTNAVISGFIDDEICKATYLSLHGIPGADLARCATTLERWSKPLHDMLSRCVENIKSTTQPVASRWDLLTPKELVIAKNASQGKSNLAIAMQLNLCESTVKTHLTHIFGKLNLRSRAELCVAFSACPPEGMRGIHVLT
jgi:DNA-binding NarL/FixJ family response regulator